MDITIGNMTLMGASGSNRSASVFKDGEHVGYIDQVRGRERGEGVLGYIFYRFDDMANPNRFMCEDHEGNARKALKAAKAFVAAGKPFA